MSDYKCGGKNFGGLLNSYVPDCRYKLLTKGDKVLTTFYTTTVLLNVPINKYTNNKVVCGQGLGFLPYLTKQLQIINSLSTTTKLNND